MYLHCGLSKPMSLLPLIYATQDFRDPALRRTSRWVRSHDVGPAPGPEAEAGSRGTGPKWAGLGLQRSGEAAVGLRTRKEPPVAACGPSAGAPAEDLLPGVGLNTRTVRAPEADLRATWGREHTGTGASPGVGHPGNRLLLFTVSAASHRVPVTCGYSASGGSVTDSQIFWSITVWEKSPEH